MEFKNFKKKYINKLCYINFTFIEMYSSSKCNNEDILGAGSLFGCAIVLDVFKNFIPKVFDCKINILFNNKIFWLKIAYLEYFIERAEPIV